MPSGDPMDPNSDYEQIRREQYRRRLQLMDAWGVEQAQANQSLAQARAGDTRAQAQLSAGTATGQRGMMAQAGMGGNNPAATRAAGYQASQMGTMYGHQRGMLRAGEIQAAQAQLQGVMQHGPEYLTANEKLTQAYLDALSRAGAAETIAQGQETAADYALAGQAIGTGMSAAGAAGAASDERLKGRARDLSYERLAARLDAVGARTEAELRGNEPMLRQREVDARAARLGRDLDREGARTEDELLRSMRGYAYEYKPDAQARLGVPGGHQYGPIAQRLEQSRLGRQMVVDTPQGKMIDYDGAIRGMLGAAGRLAERDEETDHLSRIRDELLMKRLDEIERRRR